MKTTQSIRKHLAESIKYRDNDKLLRLKVWEDMGFRLTTEQKKVYWLLPADGAISRRRRELRAEFPESASVMNDRFNQFIIERDKRSSFFSRRFKNLIK